nr:hypothetical protein B24H17.220 [imported] - Neurospora crassa [Neurospora crassa]
MGLMLVNVTVYVHGHLEGKEVRGIHRWMDDMRRRAYQPPAASTLTALTSARQDRLCTNQADHAYDGHTYPSMTGIQFGSAAQVAIFSSSLLVALYLAAEKMGKEKGWRKGGDVDGCPGSERALAGSMSKRNSIAPQLHDGDTLLCGIYDLLQEARGDPNSPLHWICLYAPWWLNWRDWRDWTPGAGNDLIGGPGCSQYRCVGAVGVHWAWEYHADGWQASKRYVGLGERMRMGFKHYSCDVAKREQRHDRYDITVTSEDMPSSALFKFER